MQYLTGYLVEKSLSMDNIFVMSLIFSGMAVPRLYQHRVLFWGILGVIVLRALMIGLGAVLVAASVLAWFALIEPESTHLNAALTESMQLQARVRTTLPTASQITETPDEQLDRFYGFFPGTSTVPDWLAVIDHAAAKEHMVLQQGEYRIVRDRLGLLTRYQVNLPLKGSYVQIAGFLQRVLKEVPIAAIESLSFERQQVGDPKLDAKLRLILFFGREQ